MRHPTLLDHNRFHPLERKEVEVHDPKASGFVFWGNEGSRDLGCGCVCVFYKGRWTKMKPNKIGVWVDLMLLHLDTKRVCHNARERCCCLIMSEGGGSQ